MGRTIETKQYDLAKWEFTLQEDSAAAPGTFTDKDLSDASSVEIFTRLKGATSLTVDGGECDIDDASGGECSYEPEAADVAVAGVYDYEVKVTFTDGKTRRYPSDGYGRLEIDAALSTSA